MFTKKTLIILLGLTHSVVWAAKTSFQDAIQDAKRSKMTIVNEVHAGVPFYSIKTLDPSWEEAGEIPIVKIPSLQLLDQHGKMRDEKLFDNKLSVVAFFFSSCAGFCPTLIKNLQQVEKKVKQQNKDVQFVAISVDPSTDAPKRLEEYAKKMNLSSSWILLTGEEDRVYNLAHETFAAEAFKLPKSKGQVGHSEHFYVVDGKRRLRGVLKGTRLDVASKAGELLAALKATEVE